MHLLARGKKHHVWCSSLGAVRRTQLSGCSGPATASAERAAVHPGRSTGRTAGLRLWAPAWPQPPFCTLYWSLQGTPRIIQRRRKKPKPSFCGCKPEVPGSYSIALFRRGTKPAGRGLLTGKVLSSCSKVSTVYGEPGAQVRRSTGLWAVTSGPVIRSRT